MNQVVIARAEPSDIAACAALLAPVMAYDTACFVARDHSGQLIGAGGVAWQSWGHPPGFPAWVHVLPDQRRNGAGTQLAERLIEIARGESPALWAAQPLDLTSTAAAFVEKLGFSRLQRQFYFRADARRFLKAIEAIVGRMQTRGRMPESARMAPLKPSNIDAVATLIEREVPSAPRDILNLLRIAVGDRSQAEVIDVSRSGVLTLDGQVVGALLSRREPDGKNSRIVVNVVSPSLRRGWANAMLLERTTRAGVDDDCDWFDFDCAEDVKDTIGLARRAEADLMRTDGLFYQAASAVPD